MSAVYFTPAQAAELAKATVRCSSLVDLEFDDETVSLWNGSAALETGGRTYRGLGLANPDGSTFGLGGIEGLEEARDTRSTVFNLTVIVPSSELLSLALAETNQVQGRIAVVSLQLFDAEWQVYGAPIPVRFGIMQRPQISQTAASPDSGPMRSILLPVESLMYGRARPKNSRYTDRETQKRSPGDKFSSRAHLYVSKTLVWPK